jgi:hypothetical protein
MLFILNEFELSCVDLFGSMDLGMMPLSFSFVNPVCLFVAIAILVVAIAIYMTEDSSSSKEDKYAALADHESSVLPRERRNDKLYVKLAYQSMHNLTLTNTLSIYVQGT